MPVGPILSQAFLRPCRLHPASGLTDRDRCWRKTLGLRSRSESCHREYRACAFPPKKPWKGKLRIIATQPNEIERTKAGKPDHDREGLTETQTRRCPLS